MIYTGPKENYCYVEVSREIKGGAQFLGQLEGVAGLVLGMQVVAHTSQLELTLDKSTSQLLAERSARPIMKPAGCEIPPPNELHLPLMHRGFDSQRVTRYPDTDSLKTRLRKAKLKDQFAEIALKYNQELEGAHIWFDRTEYLPSPGRSIILGLRPKPDHPTTRVLEEQALAAARQLRKINERLYREQQPWNLAMAVARVEIGAESREAKLLLDNIGVRMPVLMEVGRVKFDSDDLG